MIEDWKNNRKMAKKAHQKLVQRLKKRKGKKLDEQAEAVHEAVFSELNCLDCANCCKSIPPILNRTDIKRIAKHLGMKISAFETVYVRQDEDGDTVMNSSPCPFLETDNSCNIYDYRPKACRQYPHTDELSFSQNIRLHATNAQYCPAVFHILERLAVVGLK